MSHIFPKLSEGPQRNPQIYHTPSKNNFRSYLFNSYVQFQRKKSSHFHKSLYLEICLILNVTALICHIYFHSCQRGPQETLTKTLIYHTPLKNNFRWYLPTSFEGAINHQRAIALFTVWKIAEASRRRRKNVNTVKKHLPRKEPILSMTLLTLN